MNRQSTSAFDQCIKIFERGLGTSDPISFGYNPTIINPQGQKKQSLLNKNKDQRKIAPHLRYPYSTVGKLVFTISPGNIGRGTAFLIGPNLLLTAGHNIYDFQQKIRFTNHKFIPPGEQQIDGLEVRIFVPQEYINTGSPHYDYAILELQNNNLYKFQRKHGYLGTKFQCNDLQNVQIFGYPGQIMNQNKQYIQTDKMYKHRGEAQKYNQYYLKHNVDTTRGQSGSPIVKYQEVSQDNWRCLVVGIHIIGGFTENYGLKLRKQIKDDIDKFVKKLGYCFTLCENPKISFHYFARELNQIRDVVKISIQSRTIGAEDMKLLQQIDYKNLQELSLQKGAINQDTVKELSKIVFPGLKVLVLDENKLMDGGMLSIAKAKWRKLQVVSLRRTSVQNQDYIMKADWPNLKRLIIDESLMNKAGVKQKIQKRWPGLIIEN